MKAQSTGCCQRGTERRGEAPGQPRRWTRGAVGGVVFAILAALMPKCPLCIAAWLGVLGLSGVAARIDPRGLWLAVAAVTALASACFVHFLILGRRHHSKKGRQT